VRVGISIGDALAATQGFIGALMALFARDRPGGTGAGQMVDVGLYEAMWMYMESTLPEFEKLGRVRGPSGPVLPGIAPSNVYPAADGDWVIIGANQDSVFARLAELAGRPDWAAASAPYETHLGRGERQAELDAELCAWTATLDSDELLKRLAEAGVPGGRIYTARDIAADEHYAARDMIIEVPELALAGETVREPGVVPKLTGTPGQVRRGSPMLGEHNDEILAAAVGGAEVDRLRAAGAGVDNITPSGRTRPDGVRLEWETAQPHGDRGGFFPFLIHDVTPHENRVYPSGKPNAPQYTGITKVVIAVKDLDGAIAKYRKAYNLNAPRREIDARLGALTASFDGTPVVLATPASNQNWMADRIAKYGDLPCEFGIQNSTTGAMKWIR